MFQTFTGSSRRPRQVNLSGRTSNPFAKTGTATGSQAALANAQQERAQRQRERERLNAARSIQRTWRGYWCRKKIRDEARQRWDSTEEGDNVDMSASARSSAGWPGPIGPYSTGTESLAQINALLRFASFRNQGDMERLRLWVARHAATTQPETSTSEASLWPEIYRTVLRFMVASLKQQVEISGSSTLTRDFLLDSLPFFVEKASIERSEDAVQYYQMMARLTRQTLSNQTGKHHTELSTSRLLNAVATPLKRMDENTVMVYRSFLSQYLTIPEFSQVEASKWLAEQLAEYVNPRVLARVLSQLYENNGAEILLRETGSAGRLSLLGCFIFFHRHAHNFAEISSYTSDSDFVSVVAALLSTLADEVDFEEPSEYSDEDRTSRHRKIPINSFVRQQISSLISQQSVGSLFSGMSKSLRFEEHNKSARQMASYALTLLQCFPRRGDEIRLWLYLGASAGASSDRDGQSLSAIRYFSSAMQSTEVFRTISRDSRKAIELLKPTETTYTDGWSPPSTLVQAQGNINDDWRVILIFFELYTFVLKVMDDAEFFSGGSNSAIERGLAPVRNNALPLEEVKSLTTFLRNLGFTLYYNASDITDTKPRDVDTGGIIGYFRLSTGSQSANQSETVDSRPPGLAGVSGLGLDYLKGLVTGLLRMIYERDSRQPFVPKDHWLMTSRFDMESFIPGVVEEEENRHRVQEEDDQDVEEEDPEEIDRTVTVLAGTRRLQQQRIHEQLRRQQRKASRKRYLQSVAPRLEILQNLPFFIPFHTRVQIFRKFVERDQVSFRYSIALKLACTN